MTRNLQQSTCLADLCVCLRRTSPLWLLLTLLPDIIILFSASPCPETPPILPNSWIVSHNAQQPPNPSITHTLQILTRIVMQSAETLSTKIETFFVWCRPKCPVIHQGHEGEARLTRVTLRSLT